MSTTSQKMSDSRTKLSDLEVNAIRILCAHGYKQENIARWYGVTQAHVSNIKRGITRA